LSSCIAWPRQTAAGRTPKRAARTDSVADYCIDFVDTERRYSSLANRGGPLETKPWTEPRPAAPSNSQQDDLMNTLSGLGEAILATASDAIIATDRGGAVTFWNAGAVRIFGFSAAEALGQSLDLIIPDNLRDRHWRGYDRVMATGESRYGHGDLLSVPALTKDGRRISVEFTIVMLKDEQSRPTGTAAILRDVTQRFEETRKLKRDLAEALRAG
jgi:PAS domain S-box-containing protein